MSIERPRGLARALSALLARENLAIRRRAFGEIGRHAAEKLRLTGLLEMAFGGASASGDGGRLVRDLEMLKTKAEENAALLAAIRQGACDARRRLEALATNERKSGLYADQGAAISTPVAGSIARSA